MPAETVNDTAAREAKVWVNAPYYDRAEEVMDKQWPYLIEPFIAGVDFSRTLELAVGHGRNTRKLLERAGMFYGTDVNVENVEFCTQRFAAEVQAGRAEFFQNDGASFRRADGSTVDPVSFVYCFDAMVHFDSDVVRAYLRDLSRVLAPGGMAFLHHSNNDMAPGGDFRNNPHWRAFMTREMFAHYAIKEGLAIVRQKVLGWGWGDNFMPALDCFSLLRKPAD